ncbi:MAG: EutN/CcmL family microcompartment protein [Planctomycetaceae bacterium]|jgi:ethanolamine utilization protein EutN|nr:EutN/CcmL family microcompartment protein [Planctomycetaceae bacterium]
MRIVKVIGNVTLSRVHPTLVGTQWKLAIPLSFDDIVQSRDEPDGEEMVVYDELGSGVGEWIAISEGGEATMAFYPKRKPIDAYAAAILDSVELDQPAISSIE